MSPLRGFPFLLLNNAPCHACIKISYLSFSSFHVFTYNFTALSLHLCSYYMTQDEILSDHPSFANQNERIMTEDKTTWSSIFLFFMIRLFRSSLQTLTKLLQPGTFRSKLSSAPYLVYITMFSRISWKYSKILDGKVKDRCKINDWSCISCVVVASSVPILLLFYSRQIVHYKYFNL